MRYRTFGCLFGFDIHDSSKTKIHTEQQLSCDELDFMYENQGPVSHGTTKGMRAFYKCLNFLFCATLTLKSGDTTINKKIYCKAGTSFQILTQRSLQDQPAVIEQLKVIWDPLNY